MSKLALILIGVVFVCGACGPGSDDDPEPLATQSSAPIAFLRDLETQDENDEPSYELVILEPGEGRERVVGLPAGYDVESFSWSTDGRRLVLAARPPEDYRRDLFVVNVDGSELRKLRRTPDHSPLPVWSPTGDAIAWDNHDDGWHAIWVMKADGSGAKRLTPGFRFSIPAWSPDGSRIAYEHLDEPGRYVMNADGSGQRRLKTGLSTQDWTPSGIAYRGPAGIGFLERDGRPGPVVIDLGEEWEIYRFSPDGRMLVLRGRLRPGADSEIGVASIDDGRIRRLTDNDRDDLAPSLSPDGKSLVFEAYPPAESPEDDIPPGDIYVINADGTGERNLTDSPEDEMYPAWAPNP